MSDFGSSIRPCWTSFNLASVIHTGVLAASGDIAHFLHFWITWCVSMVIVVMITKGCVFSERPPQVFWVVSWKLSSISHRFCVICDYSLHWDWEFLHITPNMVHFGSSIPSKWIYFNLAPLGQTTRLTQCGVLLISVRCHFLEILHTFCTFWAANAIA